MNDVLEQVLRYHQGTKHQPDRSAPAPGHLDWANQPNPFRRYDGAQVTLLDKPATGDEPAYAAGFMPNIVAPEPLSFSSISRLFYDSLSLSAWKEIGPERWALRVNPSSGNLHPTEGYLICDSVEGLCDQPAVFHYTAEEHALELRAHLPTKAGRQLMEHLPEGACLIGLSSIHWREAWKYGERAFRYCQLDGGHAIGAVAVAAAGLGWQAQLIDNIDDQTLAALLGIEDAGEAETEAPDCLLLVGPQGIELPRLHLPMILGDSLSTCRWEGQPNRLSKATVKWPLLDDVAKAVSKPVTAHVQKVSHAPAAGFDVDVPLRKIVRQRRSAMTMDGETRMSRRAFYDMLQQVLPGNLCCRALPWRPAVHLALFVHRVDGLEPGLYALVSDKRDLKSLQSAMRDDFFWDTPHACPPGLPLYTLVTGDTQSLSQDVSCRQDIAADGCFSLGMITRFRELLERRGAWFYRALYWECGLVGQILYLAAEAAGLRATGIGCFFDDSMHNILDLRDDAWQDLYHLTVGAPVEDPRLTVLPGYPDEKHAL